MQNWTLGRDDFAGQWLLERQIIDHLAAQHGRMEGTAQLQPLGPAGLIYDEVGTMTLDSGPALAATRRYLWDFTGSAVAVAFADGRPFHSFAPSGLAQGTDHPCGDDLYRVTYDFAPWPVWTAEWRVTGPRKDYTSRSVYRPQARSDAT